MYRKILLIMCFIWILPYFVIAQIEKTTYRGQEIAADRIIIKMKKESDFNDNFQKIYNLKNGEKLIKQKDNSELNKIFISQIDNKEKLSLIIDKLNKSPDVEFAEPDYIIHLSSTIPNDTDFKNQWNLTDVSAVDRIFKADIDAPEAWDISYDCSNTVIAVMDSGIDYNHQDLADNMWNNPGEVADNGVDDDGNGYIDDVYGYDFFNHDSDPLDGQEHGTHVAGIIGAKGNNSNGIAGVCRNAKLAALKFTNEDGEAYTSDAVRALKYAEQEGMEIINISWGRRGYSFTEYLTIASMMGKQLIIAAAGNDDTDNDTSPVYPASYNLPNIISVTGTDFYSDQIYNYGLTTVDVAAPASSIYSTLPGNNYAFKSGTSVAVPQVTGIAALLWNYQPSLTNLVISAIILSTGDDLPSLAGKTVTGKRVNIYNALLFIEEESKMTCHPKSTFSSFNITDLIDMINGF